MNNGDQPLTGVKKRQEIDNTRKQVFIWTAAASAAVVVCIMVGINLFQRISYQNKVNDELGKTEKTMQQNVTNAKSVRRQVDQLKSKTSRTLSLDQLKTADSTVFQVVLDALPTSNDAVDLSSSLQREILSGSGVSIESINVDGINSASTTDSNGETTDSESGSTKGGSMPTAQPITFTVNFTGTYDQVNQALKDIERTIRPIVINKLSIQGSDSKLEVTINATTYYSPSVNFEMGEKEVKNETK